jgi:hypothetical protein
MDNDQRGFILITTCEVLIAVTHQRNFWDVKNLYKDSFLDPGQTIFVQASEFYSREPVPLN